jgi:hypothetical protein
LAAAGASGGTRRASLVIRNRRPGQRTIRTAGATGRSWTRSIRSKRSRMRSAGSFGRANLTSTR